MTETEIRSARLWEDPGASIPERVDALVAAMSPDEKLAQLGSVWQGVADVSGGVAPMQEIFARHRDFAEATGCGIGHLTRPFGTHPVTVREGARRLTEMQSGLRARGLGIPAIVHEECLTGFTTLGATVYPTSIAWAATFDPALVEQMASAIGSDMAAVGVHQGLSPVLDVVRDYRWGRVEETLGEDPYLVARIGVAYVLGLESAGIIATLKHFAGYSAAHAGRNHAPVSIGPREFRDQILPPFEAAVREGGARSVMNSYSDVDGVPAAANRELLTRILREDWGFTGTVVSDYWAVAFLKTMHRVAETFTEAGRLALSAGIDVELPDTLGFGPDLLTVQSSAPGGALDAALRRVLTQKAALGLLDAGWAPHLEPDTDLDSPRNRTIARALADESVILLDNHADLLPLAPDIASIAVIGPTGDDARAFFGCYSFPNHVLPAFPELGLGIDAPSFAAALVREFPEAQVSSTAGVSISGQDTSGIPAAVAAASAADVVVLCVGDRAGLFGGGTSGEGCDVEDLSLPGVQAELVERVLATGKPTVLVAISGRPYALGLYSTRAAAIVQSFFPGEEGGQALAGVISGRINPSGKLPVQIPRRPGLATTTYLAPPLGRNSQGVSNLDPTPAYGFGHGLSYTTFEYGDVLLDRTSVPTNGRVTVSVDVTNTGSRDGQEVVQLYYQDPVASVARPVTQLVGFQRVHLTPGQTATITFEVDTARFAYTGIDLVRGVDPGVVTLTFGSAEVPTTPPSAIRLIGERAVVDSSSHGAPPVHVRHH